MKTNEKSDTQQPVNEWEWYNRYGHAVMVSRTEVGNFYIRCPNSNFTRVGGTAETRYVDFEGGPMVGVGSKLSNIHHALPDKEIKFIAKEGYGYILYVDQQ